MTQETDDWQEDFYRGEPGSILGLIKIRNEDYALVQWTTDRKFYVPYNYIKEKHADLLIKFYYSKVNFKLMTPAKRLKDVIKDK